MAENTAAPSPVQKKSGVEKTCPNCEQVFRVRPSDANTRVCCSRACWETYKFTPGARRGGRPSVRPRVEFACANCGKIQTRYMAGMRARHSYCDKVCYHSHRKFVTDKPRRADFGRKIAPRVILPCAHCGTDVEMLASAATRPETTFCSREHKRAWLKGKSAVGRPAFPLGSVMHNNKGYLLEKTETGWRMQHRVVMERVLGRPLFDNENVHHKNGVKDDNRPENLELWVKTQPCGQRVEDVLAWAREMLRRYDPELNR